MESDWTPGLDGPLVKALKNSDGSDRLDLGCVAAHGTFARDAEDCASLQPMSKPATAFLFELIARLQESATVPMIDVRAYAQWLDVEVSE